MEDAQENVNGVDANGFRSGVLEKRSSSSASENMEPVVSLSMSMSSESLHDKEEAEEGDVELLCKLKYGILWGSGGWRSGIMMRWFAGRLNVGCLCFGYPGEKEGILLGEALYRSKWKGLEWPLPACSCPEGWSGVIGGLETWCRGEDRVIIRKGGSLRELANRK